METQEHHGFSEDELLGVVGWWTIKDVDVHHATMTQLVEDEGFEKDLVPSLPGPSRSFRRAVGELRHELSKTHHVPNIKTDADGWLWTTLQRLDTDESTHTHTFVQENVVRFFHQPEKKRKGIVESITLTADNTADPAFTQLMQRFYHYQTHITSHDARETVKRILDKSKSFRLRQDGGIYFVPAAYLANVSALGRILSRVSPGSRFDSYPVPQGSRQVDTTKQNFVEAFDRELDQFQKQFNATVFDENGNLKEGLRESTVARKISELKEYEGKATLYEEILTFQAQEARYKISELDKHFTASLVSLQTGTNLPPAQEPAEESQNDAEDAKKAQELLAL